MNSPLLLSVITPCRNSGKFLEECILSVLHQDYPYIEHVVQDGASTDNTLQILKRYQGRLNWASEPDNGQADGLNRALKRCRGDVILVLNADDLLRPGMAAWGVSQIKRHPSKAVVYGDCYIIDEFNNIIGAQFGPRRYNFARLLCVEDVLPAQAAFISRRHLEKVGLGTDPELDTCPDYEMFVRLGVRFPMSHHAGFVSRYRWHNHPDSGQARQVGRFVAAKKLVMDRVFDDPQSPPHLRKLRSRAYASLTLWAASQSYIEHDLTSSLSYLGRSLTRIGHPGHLRRTARFIRAVLHDRIFTPAWKEAYK